MTLKWLIIDLEENTGYILTELSGTKHYIPVDKTTIFNMIDAYRKEPYKAAPISVPTTAQEDFWNEPATEKSDPFYIEPIIDGVSQL
jgi:hypothetical protein